MPVEKKEGLLFSSRERLDAVVPAVDHDTRDLSVLSLGRPTNPLCITPLQNP